MQTFSRVFGCVAAYVFVLNILLVGLAGALNAHGAADNLSWQEICQPGGNGNGTDAPGGDTPRHAAKFHCLLCTAGNQVAALASETAISTFAPVPDGAIVIHADSDDLVPLSVVYLSKPPRGPPHQA